MNLRPPIPTRIDGFTGLNMVAAARKLQPHQALDCANTITRFGSIEIRPGAEKWTTSKLDASASYLHGFRMVSDGQAYNMLLAHHGTKHSILVAGSPIVSAFNVPGSLNPTAAMAYGALYVASGADPSWKFIADGKMASGAPLPWQRIGIIAPTVGPKNFAVQAFGNLSTGIYSWRYTYYNANLGIESGPSPAETFNLTQSGFGVRMDYVQSADPQVTTIRLYRSKSGVDSQWYHVDGANLFIGNGVAVDGQDIIAKNYDTQVKTAVGVPPVTNICCWHMRRMFYVDGGSIVASELDNPDVCNPLNSWIVGADENERIIGMASTENVLWVFKPSSIWALTGYGLESFALSKVVSGTGCIAYKTIVPVGAVVYYAARSGIYRVSRGGNEYLSGPVEPMWRQFSSNFIEQASAAFDEERRTYVFAGRRAGAGFDRQLVFDIDRGTWNVWQLPALVVAGHADSLQGKRTLFFGIEPNLYPQFNGDIARLAGYADKVFTDFGAPIPWFWRSGELDFGLARKKRLFFVTPTVETFPGAPPIELSVSLDGGADESFGSVSPASEASRKLRIARSGERVQFKVSGATDKAVNLNGLDVDAVAMGYR